MAAIAYRGRPAHNFYGVIASLLSAWLRASKIVAEVAEGLRSCEAVFNTIILANRVSLVRCNWGEKHRRENIIR